MRLPLLLVLLPVIELWLMIEIGGLVGAWAVIGWLILMILIGVNLLRYLGTSSILNTAQQIRQGAGLPGQQLVGSLFKAVGAILLIIPGFLTDLLALLCFVPVLQRILLQRWLAKMAVQASAASFSFTRFYRNDPSGGPFGGGNVYDHQRPASSDGARVDTKVIEDASSTSSPTDKPKTP